MQPRQRPGRVRAPAVLGLVTLCTLAGCGPFGPKTYPVKGRFELAGGDVAHLAGATIDAAKENDLTVRASGSIGPDGSFSLETLHEGAIFPGAQEGTYLVRLVPSDDIDRDARKLQRKAIAPRYLDFSSSGLSFGVPAENEVVLRLTAK